MKSAGGFDAAGYIIGMGLKGEMYDSNENGQLGICVKTWKSDFMIEFEMQ